MSYIQMLKDCDLKATPQRISVLDALDKHTHPTIDELYDDIKTLYPSISLATVYKNLNTLKDKGLVVEFNLPNQKTRYDIYKYPHIHVVCENCGEVKDIAFKDCDAINFKTSLENQLENQLENLSIVASVKTCKNCQKN